MRLRLLSFLRATELSIPGTDMVLRHPEMSDFEQWRDLRKESQSFLQKWEPSWPPDDMTLLGFKRRVCAYASQRQRGRGYTFFLIDQSIPQLLGGISLTRVRHKGSKSATLGYWMGAPYANRGLMQKAVPAILDHAFDGLKLERVDAACLPGNARSIHLLKKCGFVYEGYARQYLEINGKREDHLLFARLKTDRNDPDIQAAKKTGKPIFPVV